MGASSRVRIFNYISWLRDADVIVTTQPLLSDNLLAERYQSGSYAFLLLLSAYALRIFSLMQRRQFDLLWIEKEALPWLPLWLEKFLLKGVPYVLDYDDAVFHDYDLHRMALVRLLFGKRLDGLMAKAHLVVVGNSYLAMRAREAGSTWIEIVPTVIDLERYVAKDCSKQNTKSHPPRIVWVGSPSTVKYVEDLAPALISLARNFSFILRIVGAELKIPGVNVECIPWTEATEVNSIYQCDIGIMPLRDSPWERGKCGYKLIQYMACGLPVVASPVGMNTIIVVDGHNGFLSDGADEWKDKLAQLLCAPVLRKTMGCVGRLSVEEKYCYQLLAPQMINLLQKAANIS